MSRTSTSLRRCVCEASAVLPNRFTLFWEETPCVRGKTSQLLLVEKATGNQWPIIQDGTRGMIRQILSTILKRGLITLIDPDYRVTNMRGEDFMTATSRVAFVNIDPYGPCGSRTGLIEALRSVGDTEVNLLIESRQYDELHTEPPAWALLCVMPEPIA